MLEVRPHRLPDRRHDFSSEPSAAARMVPGYLVVHQPEDGNERPRPPASARAWQLPDGLAVPAQAPECDGSPPSRASGRCCRGGRSHHRGTQEGRHRKDAGGSYLGRHSRRDSQEGHGPYTDSAHPRSNQGRIGCLHQADGRRGQHGGHGRLARLRGAAAYLRASTTPDRGIWRDWLQAPAPGASCRVAPQALAPWDSPGSGFPRAFGCVPRGVHVPFQPEDIAPQRTALLPARRAGL